MLDVVSQAGQAHWLAGVEGFTIGGSNRPAPIGRLVAKLVEQGRPGGRPALDELASIALNRGQLLIPPAADIQHKGRSLNYAKVDAVVVHNAPRMVWLTRQVTFGQLRPEPGRLDQFDGRQMIGMSINPIRGKN